MITILPHQMKLSFYVENLCFSPMSGSREKEENINFSFIKNIFFLYARRMQNQGIVIVLLRDDYFQVLFVFDGRPRNIESDCSNEALFI